MLLQRAIAAGKTETVLPITLRALEEAAPPSRPETAWHARRRLRGQRLAQAVAKAAATALDESNPHKMLRRVVVVAGCGCATPSKGCCTATPFPGQGRTNWSGGHSWRREVSENLRATGELESSRMPRTRLYGRRRARRSGRLARSRTRCWWCGSAGAWKPRG